MFALSGSFRVITDDGRERREFTLRDPCRELLIERMIWREMDEFSQSAVCMVLASHAYDEGDYIRDYAEFVAASGRS